MSINRQIYETKLRYKNAGMISGSFTKIVETGDDSLPWHTPLIAAFLADDDIQEITFVSTNIGFVKTLTKQYTKKGGVTW